MRKLYTVFCLIVVLGFGNSSLNAQITLTYSDLQAGTADGVSVTNNEDTLATSVNIGSTGASSWNFTPFNSHIKSLVSYINPAPTPFSSLYPTATVTEKMNINTGGFNVDMYMYCQVNTEGFHFLGMSYSLLLSPSATMGFRNTKSAPDLSIQVPLTTGTTWSESYIDTTQSFYNGVPLNSSYDNYSKTYTVDAYGSATWPDGITYQVLRLKSDARKTSKSTPNGVATYSRQISYSFIAKEGLTLEISAKDTNALSSGVIELVGKPNWSTKGATGINESNYKPNDFMLNQNYPNPFNPTTVITYQVPKESKVNLRVYDMLGREVATLVNEVKPAGTYSVTFNASELPSGVYIYRFNTAHFNKSNKMILIK
jgi:hypothetical protein